ncbi:purine and uridine phosphorylase [Glonium stellatum]|uniref:Purine and uridine phosphorylase n=1 Tax=Glonium stellatum TaxID=574774 RepID=A0A8E2JU29_9PEZI|nr:purine and uridine phosphorylase [Glonium stellatum]
MTTLSAKDYQVGWICAVHPEYVVAQELLDEEYKTPRLSINDSNTYTCGRIEEHNVVMACLPLGSYGLTSAASAAKDMLRSFPSIRFGLMVGIGGGVPTKEDIRLGDVVVSTPVGQRGGVMHYAFGKTIQNKTFECTGSLNAPPDKLRGALQKLRALHARNGHRIQSTINDMVRKNKRLQEGYQRPDRELDVLFQASFVHPKRGRSCNETCIQHEDRIVRRKDRAPDADDPMIHYGLVASADQLMRNADVRDCLSETEGVLCFEMEAAGLMNQFPCVVIRGICDYSDTHKNDDWQKYAAATAASYAKELLAVIPGNKYANSTMLHHVSGED